jgi:RNA-directed DNA polymerase
MLSLYTIKRLAQIIDISADTLIAVADNTDEYVRQKTIYDPTRLDRKKRPRDVISVTGKWRTIQCRLHKRILSRRLSFSPISYGGVPGRDPKANALAHKGHRFLYVADITDFFPSISNDRVFRLFRKQLDCSPSVSRLLTKLCTYDYHLSLGLITSPILSDQILCPNDLRLLRLCQKSCTPPLIPTRFVDDIFISGTFDLKDSFVVRLVREMLRRSGFAVKRTKEDTGRIDEGMPITKVRLRGGHTDVSAEFAIELERMLDDHIALSNGREFQGPLLTSSSLEGKVLHACRINPGRKFGMRRRFRSIRWDKLWRNAKLMGLVPAEKTIVPRGELAPDFSRAYANGRSVEDIAIEAMDSAIADMEAPF